MGDVFVIEPTGDYSRVWIDVLKKSDKIVLRVNPKRVSSLRQLSGITSKTDRYDAAFLALYG
ncbi:MAG TPA: transposase, partial [Leptolyngbyaceae cyanobacterium M65_K2018_010]|nr:transposase [Leptolyngbyaceae cyanobacterium M65_K2018_010]